MAKSHQTFRKRQRERALREKAQRKRERREQRRTEKKESPLAGPEFGPATLDLTDAEPQPETPDSPSENQTD